MTGQAEFIANVRGHAKRVRVSAEGNGRYVIDIDGAQHLVDARHFAGGTWNVLIDNASFDIELEVASGNESDGAYNALVRGCIVPLALEDERRARMRMTSKRFAVTGIRTMVAPMPGKIVAIRATVGGHVEADQPLVVMEAMKMENELRAPKAGTVRRVLVTVGQTVEAHAELISIE